MYLWLELFCCTIYIYHIHSLCYRLYTADNTIAQLRAKLATPSKSTRDMSQFPTFGPPRKPIHFSPTSSSINKQPSYEGGGHNSSSSSGLQSPNSPIPLRGNQQLFIPPYPSENASGMDDANGILPPLTLLTCLWYHISPSSINT